MFDVPAANIEPHVVPHIHGCSVVCVNTLDEPWLNVVLAQNNIVGGFVEVVPQFYRLRNIKLNEDFGVCPGARHQAGVTPLVYGEMVVDARSSAHTTRDEAGFENVVEHAPPGAVE
jgi:hypothetical protein